MHCFGYYRDGVLVKEVFCPYCGQQAALTDSKEVYRVRSYGMIYICRDCKAYVGCHKGTDIPLGRLADAKLRKAKMAAHKQFDPLWQSGRYTRTQAYTALARELGIEMSECHIGMFDDEQCRRVVGICMDLANKRGRVG